MRTCLKQCRNSEYAHFGSLSEFYELQSKLYGYKAKKVRGDPEKKLVEVEKAILDEVGDCFWFIALKCEIGKVSFEKIYKAKAKVLEGLEAQLKNDIEALKSCCKSWETAPITCLKANIEKLASRAERGVIQGNGDDR